MNLSPRMTAFFDELEKIGGDRNPFSAQASAPPKWTGAHSYSM